MLAFRFFGFPVTVHWMFWLMAALLGSAGVRGLSDVPELVTWVAVVFVSILWHEFGHALFQRRYGRRSRIVLYTMGGLSIAEGGGPYSRSEVFFTAAAGPLFSLVLGVLIWVLYKSGVLLASPLMHIGQGAMVASLIGAFLQVNIFWTAVNLLPVFPLDGGQMLRAVLNDARTTALVGMIVGVAVAAAALILLRSVWLGLLFGLLAYENYQRSRGQLPGSFLGGS